MALLCQFNEGCTSPSQKEGYIYILPTFQSFATLITVSSNILTDSPELSGTKEVPLNLILRKI